MIIPSQSLSDGAGAESGCADSATSDLPDFVKVFHHSEVVVTLALMKSGVNLYGKSNFKYNASCYISKWT